MAGVLLGLRLVLAGIFVVSGVAKLVDARGSREANEQFGLPRALSGLVAVLLPLAELGVAALLLFPSTAVAGAVAALALLSVFSIAIAVNLARGRHPACNCFGQTSSEPIGLATLGRNAGIASLAVLVIGLGWQDAGPSAVSWAGELGGSNAALLVVGVIATLALVLIPIVGLALLRQQGRLLIRIEELEAAMRAAGVEPRGERDARAELLSGPAVGSDAPRFELPAVGGGRVSLADLIGADRPTLLIFSDPDCGPCDALAPKIGSWQRGDSGEVTVALISAGEQEAVAGKTGEPELQTVLLDGEREVAEEYAAHGTPSAVLVSPSGQIASAVAYGNEAISTLMEIARGYPEPEPPGLLVG